MLCYTIVKIYFDPQVICENHASACYNVSREDISNEFLTEAKACFCEGDLWVLLNDHQTVVETNLNKHSEWNVIYGLEWATTNCQVQQGYSGIAIPSAAAKQRHQWGPHMLQLWIQVRIKHHPHPFKTHLSTMKLWIVQTDSSKTRLKSHYRLNMWKVFWKAFPQESYIVLNIANIQVHKYGGQCLHARATGWVFSF